MDDLFLEQIEDLYDAEKRLVKALPKMADASTSPDLRAAFQSPSARDRKSGPTIESCF
ncbi:MAG: DUF892 family protein [Bryobacteraceae bacterium]